jgi:hypothetical protein
MRHRGAPSNEVAALLVAFALAACTRHDPPSSSASPSIALPERSAPPTAASAVARAAVSALTSSADGARPPPESETAPTPSAGSAAPTSVAAALTAVPTTPSPNANDDPASLPQTREVPHADGAAFDERVAALWRAVLEDDPDRAMPFFFPLGAYEQVKDVGNPGADWKHRLVAAYTRDIHEVHADVARACSTGRCRLVGLEVPAGRARWVEPHEEYNKIGYYRVFGSRLRYDEGGSARSFDVKSLISWRGEWYVVHFRAIK